MTKEELAERVEKELHANYEGHPAAKGAAFAASGRAAEIQDEEESLQAFWRSWTASDSQGPGSLPQPPSGMAEEAIEAANRIRSELSAA